MDPAGIAPATLRTNGRILLHKTTGPGPMSILPKEKGPMKAPSLLVRRFARSITEHLPCLYHSKEYKKMSSSCIKLKNPGSVGTASRGYYWRETRDPSFPKDLERPPYGVVVATAAFLRRRWKTTPASRGAPATSWRASSSSTGSRSWGINPPPYAVWRAA